MVFVLRGTYKWNECITRVFISCKKVVFKIDILPIVKIMSASVVHFFFLIMMVIVYWFMGYPPSLYQLQIIYYLICMWMLLIALVYTTSAIVCF